MCLYDYSLVKCQFKKFAHFYSSGFFVLLSCEEFFIDSGCKTFSDIYALGILPQSVASLFKSVF